MKVRTLIGIILIILALLCVGSAVVEAFSAPHAFRLGSWASLGTFLFHGACMIVASLLIARSPSAPKAEGPKKEEA